MADKICGSRAEGADIYGVSDDEEAPLQRQPPPVIEDPKLMEPQFLISDSEASEE